MREERDREIEKEGEKEISLINAKSSKSRAARKKRQQISFNDEENGKGFLSRKAYIFVARLSPLLQVSKGYKFVNDVPLGEISVNQVHYTKLLWKRT